MKPEIINDIERLPEGLVQKAPSFTPGNLTMFDDNGNILDAGVVPGEGGDISSEAAGSVEGDAPTIDPAAQAAINAHVNNRNNPHGVTAEQVGARPNTWTPTAQEVGASPSSHTHTAAEVGALSLTGGTLSGDIYTKNGYGRITTSDTVFQTEIRNTIGNTNDRRLITLNNSASKSLSDAVALVDVVDGAAKGYNLYGEHNKPTANDVGTVNPNLLDNWYFLNPVNQRNFTTGPGYVATEIYPLDRWRRAGYTNGVLTLGADGMVIDSTATTSGSNRLRQTLETTLPQNTYTFSVLVTEVTGTLTMSLGDSAANALSTKTFSTTGVHTITYTGDKLNMVYWGASIGSTVKVVAVKLEVGDTQTLAHQDANGNWVLNEIPNLAEETLKCQRFQLKIGNKIGTTYVGPIATGFAYNTTSVRCLIPTPVSMRTSPSIAYLGSMSLEDLTAKGDANSLAITALTAIAHNNAILLIATVSGATANHVYALHAGNSSGIMLEANI